MAIERFDRRHWVRNLRLSTRVKNAIEHANVLLVEELVTCTREELLAQRGIGSSALMEIRLALGERGLHLADDPHGDYFISEAKAMPEYPVNAPPYDRWTFEG